MQLDKTTALSHHRRILAAKSHIGCICWTFLHCVYFQMNPQRSCLRGFEAESNVAVQTPLSMIDVCIH